MIRYPGGKAGAGVYQRIINLIPPHRVYIEPFLGGGAILRHKRSADVSIAIDRDARALDLVRSSQPAIEACNFINGDAISYLSEYQWRGDEFVYCDPPYVMSTRRAGAIYSYEMDDADHERLLSTLLTIPAAIMLSGYRSELYDRTLAAWYTQDFQSMTRGGRLADERLWMNYRAPALLHDDRYLGANFRERERIKRKRHRWVRRFEQLPTGEQGAIFRELGDVMRSRTATNSEPTRSGSGNTGLGDSRSTISGDASGSRITKNGEAAAPSEMTRPPADSTKMTMVDHHREQRCDPHADNDDEDHHAITDEACRHSPAKTTIAAAIDDGVEARGES